MSETSQERVHGEVKWFNNQRGYGFIVFDDKTSDVFVHHSAIQMEGYRTLHEGDAVVFDLLDSPKGLQAVNVATVNPPQH